LPAARPGGGGPSRSRPVLFQAAEVGVFVEVSQGFVLLDGDGEGEVGEAEEGLAELEEVGAVEVLVLPLAMAIESRGWRRS
jgi:hypothetical protein